MIVLHCLACVALLGGDAFAQAAPFSVNLDYAADSGCPNETAFKDMVSAELGYDPFQANVSDQVVVRITRRGRAVDGRIEWRNSAGDWVGDQVLPLASTDCGRAASATAFALALQVQLLERRYAQAEHETPEIPAEVPATDSQQDDAKPATSPSANDVKPAEEPAVPPVAQNAVVPKAIEPSLPPVEPRFPIVAVGAGLNVGWGLSSSRNLLGRVFGGLEWRHVSAEFGVEGQPPTTTRRNDGAGFEQQRIAAEGAACVKSPRWRSCFVANVGSVALAGHVDQPISARVLIGELGMRVGMAQNLGRRLFLDAHADGLVNLNRWTVTLDRVPVWTTPRFSAALGLGIGVRF